METCALVRVCAKHPARKVDAHVQEDCVGHTPRAFRVGKWSNKVWNVPVSMQGSAGTNNARWRMAQRMYLWRPCASHHGMCNIAPSHTARNMLWNSWGKRRGEKKRDFILLDRLWQYGMKGYGGESAFVRQRLRITKVGCDS